MNATEKKKSKKGWLIVIGAILIALLAISFSNIKIRNRIYLGYYYIFKFDHFSEGDDIYVSKSLFQNKQANAIPLFRLMRPLQPDELNKIERYSRLDINIDKDAAYNVNDSPVAIPCYKYFTVRKIEAEHSALIGSYIDCKTFNVFIDDKKQKKLKNIFYSIIPNKAVVEDEPIYFLNLPVNYTWVDSTLYVLPSDISNKNPLNK